MYLLGLIVAWAIFGGRIPLGGGAQLSGKRSQVFAIGTLVATLAAFWIFRLVAPASLVVDERNRMISDMVITIIVAYGVGRVCAGLELD